MTGLLSLVNLLVLAYSVSGAPLPLQALDETAVVVESGSGGLDRDAVDAKAPGGKDNDLQTPDLDKSNAVHDLADAKPPDEKIALVDDLLIAGAVGMAGGALLGGAASRPQATQVVYEAPPQPCPYGRYAPACKNWPGYSGGASNGLGSDYYHGPHHYGRALDAVVDAKPPGLDRDAVDAKAPGGKDNDLQTPDLDKSNAVHDLADAKPPDEKIALVDDLLIAGAVGMAGGALLGGAASRPQATQVVYEAPPQPCPYGRYAPACKNWPGYSGGASNGLGSDYYHGPHHYGRALDAVVDAKPPGLDRDAVDAKAPGGKDNDLQTPDLDKSNAVHDLADAKPPDEKIALVDDLLIAGAVGMAGGALLGGAASRPQAQVIYGPPPQAPPCPNGQFLAYVGDRLRCTDHYRA